MITVPVRRAASLILGLALAAAPAGAGAGTAGLRHARSIYVDDRQGKLQAPEGVACDAGGRVVVADTGHGRLVSYAWQDGELAGGEPIQVPQLPSPTRVQLDPAGNVLALDGKLRRIARLDARGRFVGYLDVKAPPSPAGLTPIAFKVGAGGDVYVLDAAGRRVLVADASGRLRREIPLPGAGSFTDVAVGEGGEVYALDAAGATLWVAAGAGGFRRICPELAERTRFPAQLAVGPGGRLVVADAHAHAIAVLAPDGRFLARGLAAGRGDGLLYYPAQICTTASHVFVADRNNHRVQIFSMVGWPR